MKKNSINLGDDQLVRLIVSGPRPTSNIINLPKINKNEHPK